jgi:hypothetical protein
MSFKYADELLGMARDEPNSIKKLLLLEDALHHFNDAYDNSADFCPKCNENLGPCEVKVTHATGEISCNYCDTVVIKRSRKIKY